MVAKKTFLDYLVCLSLLFFTQNGFAYETVVPRYALVIGNADYKFSPLKNPVNDALDISNILRSLRYQVTVGYDQNPAQLKNIVKRFYKNIEEDNAITIFYYAGHAMQSNSVNYLIPTNANIDSTESLVMNSLSSNDLLSALKTSASKQNIIILDACRNNPFKITSKLSKEKGDVLNESQLSRLPKGLAPIEAPAGTLIAYSTEPGNTASDGAGRNGTYTSALLQHIAKSETAEALFKQVRKDVLYATNYKQTPWEHSSLIEKFYFIPPSNEEIPDIISF